LVVIFSHGFNMFHYPFYELDEGTYMARAWSVATNGKLSPYVYWYDHSPFGWMTLAGWAKLTGGFDAFGTSIDSGRAFMFILHLFSAYFLFFVSYYYTRRKDLSVLSVLIFSLSPLATFYQRRVFLDNIMLFWLLFSLYLLLRGKITAGKYWLSALFFALAVLSKETALLFLPGMIWLVKERVSWKKGWSKILGWLVLSGAVVSLYPFYAWRRGELFASETNKGISLWETLKWQIGRGEKIYFWESGSDFLRVWHDWLVHDFWFVVIGLVSLAMMIVWSRWSKRWRSVFLLIVFYVLYLLRGGFVLDFYIIPLIPFVSLLIAGTVGLLGNFFVGEQKKKRGSLLGVILIGGIILSLSVTGSWDRYLKNETDPQKKAVEWVKKNLPENSKIIINDYAYVDLHNLNSINSKVFVNAHTFWKVEKDPDLRKKIFGDDWWQVDYIISGNIMKQLLSAGQLPFTAQALAHSELIEFWCSDDTQWGYQMEIYQTKRRLKKVKAKERKVKENTKDSILKESWDFYKKNFVHNYGQVIDPTKNITTSEGQSYAMLRALWMNDPSTFQGVWQWTQDHFQYRNDDKLFSWKWQGEKLVDFNNATDADEDIALALILAARRWGKDEYLKSAQDILNSLWEKCVVKIGDHYYFLPMNYDVAKQPDGFLINPSYYSPAWYRIFATVDLSHNWYQLAEDTYWLLNKINSLEDNVIKFPKNWVLLKTEDQSLVSAKKMYAEADYFGFDAFRVFWRVALDKYWFEEEKADKYLKNAGKFIEATYQKNGKIPMIVSPNGEVIRRESSLTIDTGYLSVLLMTNPEMAKDFYEKNIEKFYQQGKGYWQNSQDYYLNNWAWFATAFYNNALESY